MPVEGASGKGGLVMSSKEHLTIFEALENLNIIAEAETLDEIEVTEHAQLISHHEKGEEEKGKEIYWVRASRDDLTVEAIKTTFRTVLDYLQSFYKKMKNAGDNQRLVEGVNTIMVLVGEAASKMDRFSSLFKMKISDLEEYKELQTFYRSKVIKETYREFAKVPVSEDLTEDQLWEKEIEALIGKEEVQEIEGVHLLNDVETVKRDHLYELFYLKNEAGHRFYSYDLARNMKLACDFGEYAKEYFGDDPLLQIKNWEDKSLHLFAKHLLTSSKRWIGKFYKEALKHKEMDLVMTLHNAVMALMLSANPRNLIRQFSLKGCHRYFSDFLFFMRAVLVNRDYQKFLIYSPPASHPFFLDTMELIQSLCRDLFTIGADQTELTLALKEMIARSGVKTGRTLAERLKEAYVALSETLKKHPNGPLFKALDLIREEDEERIFDPFIQGNIPTNDGKVVIGEYEVDIVRFPCPVIQEFIHQAYVTEEFKTYLYACAHPKHKRKHLLINFQDRTSWKEHARCKAIEELSRKAEFAEVLTVVTLAKDTDFYNQMGLYHDIGQAEEFLHHFKDHLGDESTGYAFPAHLKKMLFPDFINSLLTTIHKVFFDQKKTLSLRERLDFIELAYHFITLKLIESVGPNYLSLISKDSLDITGIATVGLSALLGIIQGKKWTEEEIDHLITVLFGPTLLNRERVIHPERFERLHDMISLLENKKDFWKAFKSLYTML